MIETIKLPSHNTRNIHPHTPEHIHVHILSGNENASLFKTQQLQEKLNKRANCDMRELGDRQQLS